MPRVSITHSSSGKVLAYRHLCGLLTLGFPVCLDTWEPRVGDNIITTVMNGIDRTPFLLFWFSHSISSPWVQKELESAIPEDQLQKTVLLPFIAVVLANNKIGRACNCIILSKSFFQTRELDRTSRKPLTNSVSI